MVKQNLFVTPLNVLKSSTKDQLGLLLDSRKIIRTDKGCPRDFRGLAELVGIPTLEVNALNNKSDCKHTELVLKRWQELSNPRVPPSIGSLQELLKELDRFDAHDDLTPLFEADAEHAAILEESCALSQEQKDSETIAITMDDIDRLAKGLGPQHYDAMLLYADPDVRKAKQILDSLEARHIKVFEKTRDLNVGVYEFDAVIELIANRCKRIIAIFSDAMFSNDRLNSFLVSFTQSVGIETNKIKLIPVTFEICKIPSKFNFTYRLDYHKDNLFRNFDDKLYDSVRPTHFPSAEQLKKDSQPLALPVQPHPQDQISDEDKPTAPSSDSAYLTGRLSSMEGTSRDSEQSATSSRPKTRTKIWNALKKSVKKKKRVALPN